MRMNIHEQQTNSDTAKVFFAIWPSPELRRSLHTLALEYQKRYGGRAMRAEDLHLTLLFLGVLERSQLPMLQQMVDAIELAAFSFSLQQIACWRHNRIAFAAPFEEVAPLQRLSERLRILVANTGIGFDRRPFTPHVTLLRRMAATVDPQPIQVPDWRVEAFSLVESMADGEGVRYRNLQTWRCPE